MLKRSKKFIRRDSGRFSKLGKGRKKLQKWRKPTGRDNKIREGRIGYPVMPSVGHKSSKKETGKVKSLTPYMVYNTNDIEKIEKKNNSILIVGKVGAKKKLGIIKKASEFNLKIANVSVSGGKK
jgi:ribosomal protein L32E